MSEQKKLVPNHQKRVTLFHKSGTAHEFEPVDAKEILASQHTEYAKELSFWDKLKEAVEKVADVVDQAVDTAIAAVDAADAVNSQVDNAKEALADEVQDLVNEVTDVVKPKKKG